VCVASGRVVGGRGFVLQSLKCEGSDGVGDVGAACEEGGWPFVVGRATSPWRAKRRSSLGDRKQGSGGHITLSVKKNAE